MRIIIEEPAFGKALECKPILYALPEWFGIEEAIHDYLQNIEELPTLLARFDDRVIGFLTLKRHTVCAAEILVMGVMREAHRKGIGRALVEKAESCLRTQGVRFLQVKTLSSGHPDANYGRTRQFYEAVGFCPLEEIPTLWGAGNPCLLMIKGL